MNKWGHLLLCSLALLNYAAGKRRLHQCVHCKSGGKQTALKPGGLFGIHGPQLPASHQLEINCLARQHPFPRLFPGRRANMPYTFRRCRRPSLQLPTRHAATSCSPETPCLT